MCARLWVFFKACLFVECVVTHSATGRTHTLSQPNLPLTIYQHHTGSATPVNPLSSNHHSDNPRDPPTSCTHTHTHAVVQQRATSVSQSHTHTHRKATTSSDHTNIFHGLLPSSSAPQLAASTETSTTVATVTATTGIN